MRKLVKVVIILLTMGSLAGISIEAGAYTHYRVESHGAIHLTGAYEQYWNNYSGHYASVIAKKGATQTKYAGVNGTAYAQVNTSFGRYAWFKHWDK
ncbi:MAG: hypothetical protein LBI43_00125 [Streptococcaceae bacterium]|jgi:hypothetical protein|nr:hypothetical protein [Streptococcaceae bacterium]